MASDSISNDPNPTVEGQDLSWRERGIFPALAIFLFGPTLKQERVGALPWVRRILLGWPRTQQAGPHSTSVKEGVDGQTDPLLLRLARLGIAMLVVICFYGFSLGIRPQGFAWSSASQFIVWGLIGAMAAALCGLALGMLFGLPTTRGWTPRRVIQVSQGGGANTPPSILPSAQKEAQGGGEQELTNSGQTPTTTPTAVAETKPPQGDGSLADHDIPYDENTSLEQIADWLTKIIVGLTLVQFSIWRDYFETTARLLSSLMYKNDVPTIHTIVSKPQLEKLVSSIPGADPLKVDYAKIAMVSEGANPLAGGLVMTSFALLGFLMAYLWMRRYFIPEMVIARRNAVNLAISQTQNQLLAEQRRLEEQQRKAEEARQRAEDDRRKAALERQTSEAKAKLEAERAKSSALQNRELASAPPPEIASVIEKTVASGLPDTEVAKEAIQKILGATDTVADDPWKGRFGGQSVIEGFELRGKVAVIENNPDWFSVELTVCATTAEAVKKVAGQASAIYFLHPSFTPITQRVAFGTEGIAPLRLIAYGAFTVGVLLEDGTRLELNLASLASAKQLQVFLAT
jgi:hypothetical protein